MTYYRKPFEPQVLDEDKDENTEVISVRLNISDRERLNKLKDVLGVSSDALVLRLTLSLADNVIPAQFGVGFWDTLIKKKRLK